MDIANPMTGSGSFEYIDWGIWAARVVSDAVFAGAVAAVVALALLALIVKIKPDAELPRWQKVLIGAFVAPLLVIGSAYVFRLLTHADYFTWERLAAIADVYWRVLAGTGAWILLADALGIDLQSIIDFIKAINNPPIPAPVAPPGAAVVQFYDKQGNKVGTQQIIPATNTADKLPGDTGK